MIKRWLFSLVGVLLFWGGMPALRSVQAQQVCRITALGAMVLPTRFNGRCWDIGCFGKKKKKLHKFSRFLEHVKDILNWKAVLAKKAFRFASTGTYLPDTFAIVKINGMEVLRTKRSANTLLPMWGQSAQIPMSPSDTLEIYVYDWDRITSNDPMGFYASVGIPRKFIEKGGIIKLRFGRVQEFQLMIKPIHKTPPLWVRKQPHVAKVKEPTVKHPQRLAIRRKHGRVRPPALKPVLRQKIKLGIRGRTLRQKIKLGIRGRSLRQKTRLGVRGRTLERRPLSLRGVGPLARRRSVTRRRPMPRLFLPPLRSPRPFLRLRPRLRVIVVDPPRLKPMLRVVVRPRPRPRPSPLVVITKQAMGKYDLDKTKMLRMAKFLQRNLHKLPKARRVAIGRTLQMIRGMRMSLQLHKYQRALFTSVHRFPQRVVTRRYRGTWSWHVLGTLLTLHLTEQGLKGKAKTNSRDMTISCRYWATGLLCTNIHGRNHKYKFQKKRN